ncbi:MAG: hypothetical protein LBI78_02650 [Campylobacteraceae bacterium]|jgi:hypothetical protein|nr:hypothetical protein [Campylobacteraceae bacterium]
MKTLRYFFVLFILSAMAFLLIGCATVGQKAEINYVKSIPVLLNTEVPLEKRCYIATKEYSYIFAINDVDRPRDAIHRNEMVTLISGMHQLTVQYNDGDRTSSLLRVVFNFEEGQNYYLNYEITDSEGFFSPDSIRFFITKLTDEKTLENSDNSKIAALASIEKVKAYLAFSDANPTYLAGTWYYENSYPPFNNKITFQNDRFTITSFNRWRKFETITSGRYVFNNETIVMVYEKKQDKDFFAREVLYYELENEFLNILDAPQSAAILTVGSLKGKYHKTD